MPTVFAEMKKRQPTLKFIHSLKGPRIAKTVLKTMNKSKGLTLPNVTTYCSYQHGGASTRTDRQANGAGRRAHEQTLVHVVTFFLT